MLKYAHDFTSESKTDVNDYTVSVAYAVAFKIVVSLSLPHSHAHTSIV